MQTTECIWLNGKLTSWDKTKVHVLTHTLHYGGGAFEGIRFYSAKNGTAIFRLKEHVQRLLFSMNAIKMKTPYSAEEISAAIKETVKANKLREGYIRPIAYYGYGVMGVNPKGAPIDLAIACWPWGAYLEHDLVNIKTSSFIRNHPKSTISEAKLCGGYLNSMMARLEIQGTSYDEALLLDVNGNVAEGSGENFFMVKDGALITPKKGSILPGITRDTIITFAHDLDIKVIERDISLKEVYSADETFFTGTAAEVTPIRSIDDQVINKGEMGAITKQLRELYGKVVRGEVEKYQHYLTYV